MVEIVKINNPLYIAQIAPLVKEFTVKVPIDGIIYESLCSYFQRIAQFGGEISELWVALQDKEPVGFVNWCVLDLPYAGTTQLNYIYSKPIKNSEVVLKFMEQWRDFANKHNCLVFKGTLASQSLFVHFNKIAEKFDYDLKDSGMIQFVGRRKKI